MICSALAWAALGNAQKPYPSKPIRLVVAAPAGGPVDFRARQLAEKLAARWRVTVIVDNRSGAAGIIGTEAVAKAAPDGYTLILGHTGTHAIHASLYRKLPYDPLRDFTPVTLISSGAHVLVVNPEFPATTLKAFVALAKSRPGVLTYGSAGIGSPQHIEMEAFKTAAGIDLQHIPYKGSAPMLVDLTGNHVAVAFDSVVTAVPLIKAGKLRAIAIGGPRRIPLLPDVPTFTEAGIPFVQILWVGLFAPAHTPADRVQKLHKEVAAILQRPDVRQSMTDNGLEAGGSTPEEFAAFVKAETAKWGQVVRASGAAAD